LASRARRPRRLPNRLTWLFFRDEAIAFAAGHRPCALCRRASCNDYRDVFTGVGPKLKVLQAGYPVQIDEAAQRSGA
jgi:hypothetical protein